MKRRKGSNKASKKEYGGKVEGVSTSHLDIENTYFIKQLWGVFFSFFIIFGKVITSISKKVYVEVLNITFEDIFV